MIGGLSIKFVSDIYDLAYCFLYCLCFFLYGTVFFGMDLSDTVQINVYRDF